MRWQPSPPIEVIVESPNGVGVAEWFAAGGQVLGAILGGAIAGAIAVWVMNQTLDKQTAHHEDLLEEQRTERREEREHAAELAKIGRQHDWDLNERQHATSIDLIQAERRHVEEVLLVNALTEVTANLAVLRTVELRSDVAPPVLATESITAALRLFDIEVLDELIEGVTSAKLWNLQAEPMVLTMSNAASGSQKVFNLTQHVNMFVGMHPDAVAKLETVEEHLNNRLRLS